MKPHQFKRRHREWENSPLTPITNEHKRLAAYKSATPPESSSVRTIEDFFSHPPKNARDCIMSSRMQVDDPISSTLTYTPLSVHSHNEGQRFISSIQYTDLSEAKDTGTHVQRCSPNRLSHQQQQPQSKRLCSSPPPNKSLFFISPYGSKSKVQDTFESPSHKKNTNMTSSTSQRCFICNHPSNSLKNNDSVDVSILSHDPINNSNDTRVKNSLLRYFSTTKPPPAMVHPQKCRVHYTPSPTTNPKDILEPCSFCDRPVCQQTCIKVCEMCQGRFCTFCSTVNYSGRLERIYCLDCNTTVTVDTMDLS